MDNFWFPEGEFSLHVYLSIPSQNTTEVVKSKNRSNPGKERIDKKF